MLRKTKSRYSILLIISLLFLSCFQETKEKKDQDIKVTVSNEDSGEIIGEINIIPQPSFVKRLGGQFEINSETKIVLKDELAINPSNLLNEIISRKYKVTLEVINQIESPNMILFSIVSPNIGEDSFEDEEYSLKIEPNSIAIKGTERGVFYAIQTLNQIIEKKDGKIVVPAAEISDEPRFAYRGMHLDVARHYMPVGFVKKYISLLAFYKFNYFHWHLTDDQGWRIEIKKYPRLTQIGSNRRETVYKKQYDPYKGDGRKVGGYYTQEQIREIVEFAKRRNITIIPEIDMPGHASAALAAYPQLGCRANYKYKVQTTWGGFTDIFCPKDKTFNFLEDVLTEVIDLFPNSEYIHIGGDEVKTDHWTESKFVKDLKKREGLGSDIDVQNWFIERIEKFVASKGKKMIVWDEVINRRLSDDATIMAWQDVGQVVKAAQAKHKVIATPTDFTYFDHPQANPETEPLSLGSSVTLETVYGFDPIPDSLSEEDAKYIIGGQGCLWTEFIKNSKSAEYMAFPRSIALAEVLWSKKENRNYDSFKKRLKKEFVRLDREQVNYRIPKPINLIDQGFPADQKALVDLETPVPSGKMFYTINGDEPTIRSNYYREPFELNLNTGQTITVKVLVLNSTGRESSIFSANYSR